VEVGTLAAQGMAGFVLADCSRMKAIFGVPERVAALVRVGQPLELQGDAAAEPLAGRITAVAPAADTQSRVFNVEVTVPNPRGEVRAGTIATVRVPGAGAAASAAVAGVPLSAVIRSRAKPGGYSVFVVEEEKGRSVVRAREVELGEIAGNVIHVEAGLDRKDRVVVTGATLVSDGEPIRVVE
jgi:membrane fusion protein, multidrug efflux system